MILRLWYLVQDWFRGGKFGGLRSAKWSDVRNAHIRANPLCAACGCKSTLLKANEVHHVQVYHLNPELELDPNNLITLCRVHHLWLGHLGNWKSWNVSVKEDATTFLTKVKNRPKGHVSSTNQA